MAGLKDQLPAVVCQVRYRGLAQLTCDHRESGGKRCEELGEHEHHRVGVHTIDHERAGNGYTCRSIEQWRGRWVST